jgi:hypothetical protein
VLVDHPLVELVATVLRPLALRRRPTALIADLGRQVLELDARPCTVTTRRSMTFSSSRTLPGHEILEKRLSSRPATPGRRGAVGGGELAEEVLASSGMSPRRSRSGGTTM